MRKVASGPPVLGVDRQFEASRFSPDWEMQAYELACPVGRRSVVRSPRVEPQETRSSEAEQLTQGGVAA